MSEVTSGTRKSAVLSQLRDEIVSNQLEPGTILKDAEIAARLGVSITPVREAIGQLAAEGLIDMAPDRTRRVTHVTQKGALELIDLITVLSCAAFEWGVDNLVATHMVALRCHFREFDSALRRGDLSAVATEGWALRNTVTRASGNQELQTHVDLIATRSLRMLALTRESEAWDIWRAGLFEILQLLETGQKAAAVKRYRQIYVDYRACVEATLFAQPDRSVRAASG